MLRRLSRCVTIPFTLLATAPAGIPHAASPALYAQANVPPLLSPGDTIRVSRRFLGGLKYAVGGSPEKSVVDPWIGLALTRGFTDVLSPHPDALAEAKSASPYLAMSFLSNVGLVATSVMLLMKALDESQSVSSGRVESQSYTTEVTLFVASLTVGVIGGALSGQRIRRAVSIFNEKQRSASNPNDLSSKVPAARPLLAITSVGTRPAIHVGLTIATR